MNFIENNDIKLGFTLDGGNMISIFSKKYNKEMQYQVMKKSWQSQDVVIFPFVARLKDKTYTVNGEKYELESHGLCRYNSFKIFDKKDDEVTLLFKSNKETLKRYPFEFEFYVNYKIVNNSINICYKVKNINDFDMYFGIGGHPALKVPFIQKENEDDTSGNFIEFDKEIRTFRYIANDKSFQKDKIEFITPKKYEVSKENIRKYGTLILDAKNIKHLVLKRSDGININYDFNTKFVAFWSHPYFGDYICVEPWDSLNDFENGSLELKEKPTINTLSPNSTYLFKYSIKID